MSEVIADLDYSVVGADGREYFVNVAAEPTADGRWEAWLEFVPLDDSEPLLSNTETYQSTRADVARWASTLGEAFVDGAFERVTSAADTAPVRSIATLAHPIVALDTSAELDPFAELTLGKDVLRAQLRRLPRPELMTIIDAYELNPAHLSLARLTTSQLVTFIVTAAEVQALQGRRT